MSTLNKKTKRSNLYIINNKINSINYKSGSPSEIITNKAIFISSCLQCAEPKCIYYYDDEYICSDFSEFSYERNNNVCPISAITFEDSGECPKIDTNKCLLCGLCALRCPVGAIYYKNNKMYINNSYDINYQKLEYNKNNVIAQNRIIQNINLLNNDRNIIIENENIFNLIYEKITKNSGRENIHSLLIRNLLISIGYKTSISRIGDVYTRIDAVYANKDASGAIEIEFGTDTLEASRAILDDIAVLHSRHNFNKKNNTALVICLSFPNKRQGYYQVMYDIKNILDLKIQTLSLGALLILAWNSKVVNFKDKLFFVDFNNLSIRQTLERCIGRKINIGVGHLGILEPNK